MTAPHTTDATDVIDAIDAIDAVNAERTEPELQQPPMEEAFPELRRLGWRQRGRRVPHVQQLEWTDCGAACIASVLGFFGCEVGLRELRAQMSIGRDGVSAADLLEAANRYGLLGRGVRLEAEDVRLLPRASVLHWEFNHFVVFDRMEGQRASIVDPSRGRRLVSLAELGRSFTGIALLFEPSPAFTTRRTDQPRPGLGGFMRALLFQRAELGRILLLSLLLRCLASTAPLLVGVVVDKVVPRGDLHLLFIAALGLGAMLLFEALASLVRAHLLLQVRTRVDTRMTLGFLEHLVSLPYAFFQARSTGDLMLRVHSTAIVREILTSSTLSALLDGAFVVLYLVAIALVSPLLALLVAGAALINAALFLVTRARSYRLMVVDVEAQSRAQAELIQIIEGIQTLKCGGGEQRAVQNWSSHYVDELNASLARASLAAWVDSARQLLEAAAPLALLSVGACLVVRGELSLGAMLAVNALAAGVFGPISALVASALQLQLLRGYMERIEDVMSTAREQERAPRRAGHALRGHLAADHLTFRYSGAGAPVIDDLSLEIPPGASVAIVGASGSGKSTLASLLCGLQQAQEGEVYFDGVPLAELDLRSLRQQIGIVPQHPYIFAGTVRENIALTRPGATLEEVERAGFIACIHDEVTAMPLGYQTVLAGGGSNLSGGQRQRIAIARAVIGGGPILMLDEATSALDAVTEALVMRHLALLSCTRIVIAHRLSTVADADLIVVLHEGRIVELGRHADLLARGGNYSHLIRLQGGAVMPAPPRMELLR